MFSTILGSGATTVPAATIYPDAELIDGFIRTVFGAEETLAGAGRDVVRKFDDRIRVRIVNHPDHDYSGPVRRFIRHINRSVTNLDIESTRSNRSANMIVHLVERRNYKQTVRAHLPEFNTRFLEENACSGAVRSRGSTIVRAELFVVVDDSPAEFRHCVIEEILQSLGPINDDRHLSHSIFNDYANVNSFTVFDWYILNALYDRRVKPGMSIAQVLDILPLVIMETRLRQPAAEELASYD